jgi:type IV pilus assembly protein PilB
LINYNINSMEEKITGQIRISPEKLLIAREKIKCVLDLKEELERFLEEEVTESVEILMAGSLFLEVSDIHFEPKKENVLLRVRIDGVLHDVLYLSHNQYLALLSRLKLLSGLKLNITDKPQDGRFSLLIEKDSIEIRTSSLPAEYGESIVLRVLNPKWVVSMEALGLREDMLEVFYEELKKPNGMIICTGPTGSGKTTTLYAFLQKLISPEIKIITVEDPIEYHLPGVAQTQVDESRGYTFASALRAVVRQDPDVILVGEVRDFETAKIALQAALTGHLVFTTLHTNDAAGTVARFLALGEKLENISPALNLVIGQRLVRTICPFCKTKIKIPKEKYERIASLFKNLPPKVKPPPLSPETEIIVGKGCRICNFTGYKGRLGIFEAFQADDEIKRFILKNPSIPDLKEFAIKKGMVPMHIDGYIKALEGKTTIEEVERVTAE